MKRKVIQLAGKTYVVTLPNEWIKQWGIKKGEELEVKDVGPKLIVSTEQVRNLKRGVVDVNEATEQTLKWILSSMHKKGYDEIELQTSNEEHSKIVDDMLRNSFMGLTVINKTPKSIIIGAVSRELDDQLQTIVRRAFLVTVQMCEEISQIAKTNSLEKIDQVLSLEKMNNQLTNFVERVLNKKGLDDPIKNSFLYVIIWNLEKIGDQLKKIVLEIQKRKSIDKNSQILLEKTSVFFRDYYNIFYNFNIKSLIKFSEDFKNLKNEIEKEFEKTKNPLILSYLHSTIIKISEFISSTFALND